MRKTLDNRPARISFPSSHGPFKSGSQKVRLCAMAVLSSALLLCATCEAKTLTVPGNYGTIQAAIDAASSGDSILVGPGLYQENLDTESKRLDLVSTAGAAATIIDGGHRGTVLRLYPAGSISGFTVQSGQAPLDGGGIRIAGPGPTVIANNIIQNNVAGTYDMGTGGGVCIDFGAAGVTVQDNTIISNYAGSEGGGIGVVSAKLTIQITGNVLRGNSCHVAGGGASLAGCIFDHNVVVANFSDNFGGGIFAGGELTYNTVVDNVIGVNAVLGAGMHNPGILTSHNIVVRNHGPVGTTSGVGILSIDNFPEAQFDCNDGWGNGGGDYYLVGGPDTTGRGNFSADPLFCRPDSYDLRLAPSSPCVGGSCGLVGALSVDVGCAVTVTRSVSWGEIKARYR